MTSMTESPKTPLSILKEVRTILSSHDRWTQRAFARDIHGKVINYLSPFAICFCLGGAISRCAVSDCVDDDGLPLLEEQGHKAWILVDERAGPNGLVYFNDYHSYEEVLALLDSAIAFLDSEGNQNG